MALAYAKQGADLVILARRLEKLEDLSNEIEKLGRKCLPIKCDVTSVEDIKEAGRLTEEKFGKRLVE